MQFCWVLFLLRDRPTILIFLPFSQTKWAHKFPPIYFAPNFIETKEVRTKEESIEEASSKEEDNQEESSKEASVKEEDIQEESSKEASTKEENYKEEDLEEGQSQKEEVKYPWMRPC